MTLQRYFATCGRGIETILVGELQQLGASDVSPGRGGVHFAGDRTLLYRANLWLRTAIRVLWPILDAPVSTPDELYEAVGTIDWSAWMTPAHTLAVDCNVRDSAITHSQYAARRVKDAICDQFLARVGKRPSVDPETPMLGFNLHIYKNQATLSLDSSGMSLHKRGYRPIQTRAPLNEALAAAIVLRTGWRGETPFVDPMCGSGTLCIEAAWLALRRPPGLTRKRFGFMGWMDYDVALWTSFRDEARRSVRKTLPAVVTGSDSRGDAVAFASNNARAAGIGHLLGFTKHDFKDLQLDNSSPGILVCNPPYGERLGEERELVKLYRHLGETFRARWAGWTLWVFTGNQRLAREIGLPSTEKVALFNGKIPCQLLRFL
jgi:putative N6-adenine-specific DNA methylase